MQKKYPDGDYSCWCPIAAEFTVHVLSSTCVVVHLLWVAPRDGEMMTLPEAAVLLH